GLVDDLLDLSRLESGRLKPQIESFVLAEALAAPVAILRPQAEAKELKLTLRIDPHLPPVCRGLPVQLRHVATNRLANAMKFPPPGHIAITASRVQRSDKGLMLRLAVRDEGIGIAAAARARIFDGFAQADGAAAPRSTGSGLGLAITRQLVELMGGT